MLSAAKHLSAQRDRPSCLFASLRASVAQGDSGGAYFIIRLIFCNWIIGAGRDKSAPTARLLTTFSYARETAGKSRLLSFVLQLLY